MTTVLSLAAMDSDLPMAAKSQVAMAHQPQMPESKVPTAAPTAWPQ